MSSSESADITSVGTPPRPARRPSFALPWPPARCKFGHHRSCLPHHRPTLPTRNTTSTSTTYLVGTAVTSATLYVGLLLICLSQSRLTLLLKEHHLDRLALPCWHCLDFSHSVCSAAALFSPTELADAIHFRNNTSTGTNSPTGTVVTWITL